MMLYFLKHNEDFELKTWTKMVCNSQKIFEPMNETPQLASCLHETYSNRLNLDNSKIKEYLQYFGQNINKYGSHLLKK